MKKKVLLVEDEPAIAENLIYGLETENYQVVWEKTSSSAYEKFVQINSLCIEQKSSSGLTPTQNFSIIILDIGLPDFDGFELAKKIRKDSEIPIIFLSARSSEIDKVVGLEIGADDYLTKPCSIRELTARVKAILKRTETAHLPNPSTNWSTQNNSQNPACSNSSSNANNSKGTFHKFQVDEIQKKIFFDGAFLELTKYEFEILKLLLKNPGRVFSRESIMSLIWEEPEMSLERTIDTHIKSLRQKLKRIIPEQEIILTSRGYGYYLKASPE